MDLKELHFAHPLCLWMLLAIPLIAGLFFLYYRKQQPQHQLEKFIDKHLIPHLLVGRQKKTNRVWTSILLWSIAWASLVFALAGPRWSYRELDVFTRDQSLAILIDLSESMNVQDVSPSRLGRAKQKIEDLLNISKGVKIGLIAFAADPHMIVPMTDDKETVRHLLPSLDTDLVYVQGSKLTPALEMAGTMLENEPGNNKAIVVLSDGGFDDASAIHTAKSLAGKGIVLHTVGVGSLEGAPVKNRKGMIVKKNGSPIMSKLEKDKFREISKIGNGRYFDADHSGETALIFEDLAKKSDVQKQMQKTQRFWEERFYLFLLPVLPLFLLWFRRGYMFSLLLFALAPISTQASLPSYFYNDEQKANHAYENENYQTAADGFQDPYRKGVAYYRMGDYQSAEEMFLQSTRPEVASSAAYNLGNALALQNKLTEAIKAYEDLLKKWPDHKQAKENLELLKKKQDEEQQQKQGEDKSRERQQEHSSSQENEKESKEQQEESAQKNPEEKKSKSPKEQSSSQESEKGSEEQQEESAQKNSEEKKSKSPQEQSSSQEHERENKEQQNESRPMQQHKQISEQAREKPQPKSQEDQDADLWLNQIKSDPKAFLKKKFYLDSKRNGTKEEVDPW